MTRCRFLCELYVCARPFVSGDCVEAAVHKRSGGVNRNAVSEYRRRREAAFRNALSAWRARRRQRSSLLRRKAQLCHSGAGTDAVASQTLAHLSVRRGSPLLCCAVLCSALPLLVSHTHERTYTTTYVVAHTLCICNLPSPLCASASPVCPPTSVSASVSATHIRIFSPAHIPFARSDLRLYILIYSTLVL